MPELESNNSLFEAFSQFARVKSSIVIMRTRRTTVSNHEMTEVSSKSDGRDLGGRCDWTSSSDDVNLAGECTVIHSSFGTLLGEYVHYGVPGRWRIFLDEFLYEERFEWIPLCEILHVKWDFFLSTGYTRVLVRRILLFSFILFYTSKVLDMGFSIGVTEFIHSTYFSPTGFEYRGWWPHIIR